MATTTNFGWETPDDTDLVKDGALAIRTLGSAIDTSLVDLKGGTTGQVLSKTSNTDMDFTWVTSDDANAIQNAIVDAKGDLISASAADVPARLAVGNNGETLVADSSATTGLRWTATPTASNPVINGAFDIWQRGTTFSNGATNNYTADRWTYGRGGNATGQTVSRQATGDTTNLPNIQYALRSQRANGNTDTSQLHVLYNMETVDSIPYAGKRITFSYYARRGANYSQGSNALDVIFVTGTGTDQNIWSGYTSQTTSVFNSTLTTTWQRFTHIVDIASTATQMGFYFRETPSGTAGVNDWFEVTGVQIDVGNTALPFRRTGNTLAGELAACQRYYYRLAISGSTYGYFLNSANSQTTITLGTFYFPVTMRVAPSFGSSAANTFMVYHGTTITAGTSITMEGGTSINGCGIALSVASGLTAGDAANIRANNTSAHLEFSSEL